MNEIQIKMIQNDCNLSCTDSNQLLPLKDTKILITGGTGFVGKWICEMISHLNENYNFNIQLYLLCRDIESFIQKVPHLANKKFISLIQQDVRNLREIPTDIHWVVNAAATPDSRDHVSQPQKVMDTIYRGTSLVLEHCCRLTNLNKILHLSSNQVYGQVKGGLKGISENQFGELDCNKFTNIYAESKRISESICSMHRNQYGLPIVISRPFAFVGPYHSLDKPWAINNFIRDALMGGPIRILGNKETIRSYLYGSDMAYWLLVLLVNGKIGEVYNTGSSEKITLYDLAKKINHIIGLQIDSEIKSSRDQYQSFSISVPDVRKIKSDTNVKEMFNITQALERTITWNRFYSSNK